MVFACFSLYGTAQAAPVVTDLVAGKADNAGRKEATDGNSSTYLSFYDLNPSVFTFNSPARITRVSGLGSSGWAGNVESGWRIIFYDSANAQIGTVRFAGNVTNNVNVDFKNVAYAVLRTEIQSSYSVYVNNLNLFGYYDLPQPTNFTATPGSQKVELKWVDFDLSGFLRYEVLRNGNLIGTTNTRSYTDDTAAPDVEYTYTVYGVYDVGNGPSATVKGKAYEADLATPEIKVDSTIDTITLSYGVPNASNYKIYVDGKLHVTTGEGTYRHEGLPINDKHTYVVVAVDKYGREYSSQPVEASTREPPPPVNIVLQANTVKHNSINLSWTAAGTMYQVMDGQGGLLQNSMVNYATITDLVPETSYTFKIYTTDFYGRQLASNTITVKTIALPAPKIPVVRFLSVTNKSARAIWDNVGSQYKVALNGAVIGETKSLFYQFNDLTAGTSYEVTVSVIDEFGREVSGSGQFTTSAPSPTPTPGSPGSPGGGGGADPPPVADSGNPDLDKPTDHLVDGGKQVKDNGMSLVVIIIGVLILIFGSAWLIKLFRKKMGQSKSAGSNNSSVKSNSSKAVSAKVSTAKPVKNGSRNYNTSQNGTRRKKYYVEKSYPKSKRRSY